MNWLLKLIRTFLAKDTIIMDFDLLEEIMINFELHC